MIANDLIGTKSVQSRGYGSELDRLPGEGCTSCSRRPWRNLFSSDGGRRRPDGGRSIDIPGLHMLPYILDSCRLKVIRSSAGPLCSSETEKPTECIDCTRQTRRHSRHSRHSIQTALDVAFQRKAVHCMLRQFIPHTL